MASGGRGERCPTNRVMSGAACKLSLVGLMLALGGTVRGGSQDQYLEALVDFQRHGDTIWSNAGYSNAPPDAGYWGDGNSGENGGIRGNCGVAVSYAVLARQFPEAPERAARLAKVRQALNYAANTHVSGTHICRDKAQWGHGWQTALWAGSMGLACVLVEEHLPESTVAAVRRAVADEATYRAGIPPASGYRGDTKAEENGWNANVVALAAAWMPSHPDAASWLESAKRYLANTYSTADTSLDPLAAWVTTTTLYPDFSLENHGFYHPTYHMVAGMSMGDSLLMAELCSPAIAEQLRPFAEHNVLNVWTNLQAFLLDSGEFAYPSGLDWELHDFEQNSYMAFLAAHFGDPLARWADSRLAELVRYRQIVNGDGRFVGESMSNGFFREAVEARRTAIAWLQWAHAAYPDGPASAPQPLVAHGEQVKIISHRGPGGFASISYGAKIMAVIEPPAPSVPTNAFLTTPRLPGIIGLGALGDPTAARLMSLATNESGFFAEIRLTNSSNGFTDVYVHADGATVAVVEVPWPAAGVTPEAAGSFSVGIENDPLSGGSRLLQWDGGSAVITNRSGAIRTVTNAWVCVAGRLGMTAGPGGYLRYQAASSYNRPGAAQDTLQFIPDDPFGARYAVWFPGAASSETASRTAGVVWHVNGATAVLSFTGANGAAIEIEATLPGAPPPLQPYLVPIASITASSSQEHYPAANAADGNLSNFWVSAGTAAGQGPTPAAPEFLIATFDREVAVSRFVVYPRTQNGGYGPKDLQLLLNGQSVYAGTMAPTAALELILPQPIYATNAQLLITSSYDPSHPTNPRNVQVMEIMFFERALPGTYDDWVLHRFTESQLADGAVSGTAADPDHDGLANLLEFAAAGDPWATDPEAGRLAGAGVRQGTFQWVFRERKRMAGVERFIESSEDLVEWSEVIPAPVSLVEDHGEWCLYRVDLPLQRETRFLRAGYRAE